MTHSKPARRAARIWHHILRLGFRLLYNELAWTYDIVSWTVSLGQWRDWQQAGLPYVAAGRILEVAHGPGHMLLALKSRGAQVVGLDLSVAMAELASRRLRRAGLNVPLVRGRAQAVPFAADTFDGALATFPTEFIVDKEAIASLFRVLRPGASLVIVPEARLTGRGMLRHIIEWLYTITGQRLENDDTSNSWLGSGEAFNTAGFQLQVERITLEGSEVTVVIAQKPASSGLAG